MKKYLFKIFSVLIMVWMFLYTPLGVTTGASADKIVSRTLIMKRQK